MKLMIRAHDLGVKGEDNIVKRIDEWGLDGIQLVAYKSINGVSYSEGSLTEEKAKQIATVVKEAGKEIALVGAYFNPVHPNQEKAAHGEAMFREYLSLSSFLGCRVVGSETGSYMGDPWGYHEDNRTDMARDRVVRVFRGLADFARSVNASIAIEGAYNHVCYSPDALFDTVKRIDRDNVRVIFDLYNYLDISNYTSAYSILRRGHELFGSDILLYHLKDFTVEDGRLKQCAVGNGILDYKCILGEIYAHNKDAVLVLEGTVGEDVPESVQFIRKIINEISHIE
jgi:sugar phosphate isomerase/epimerase